MILTLEARYPCHLCGFRLKSWSFPGARVNKRSIRVTGPSITCGPARECPECGAPVADELAARFRLSPGSVAEIAAYRARRWPELREAV